MSWSSGKDSAMALHAVRTQNDLDVTALLVTMNAEADRIAMHAVRRELLAAQAARLDLPVHVVDIPSPCPNDVYEAAMTGALAVARDAGVERMVFGDLFLEDVRDYRETRLADTGNVTLCAPASSARWNPLRLGASATTFRFGIVRAKLTISAVSAIAGISFGGTNEPTSISRKPAAASAAIHAFFASVGMRFFAFCRPSRGPTSQMWTSLIRRP